MRLLDRLRGTTSGAGTLPDPAPEGGELLLRSLGENGFGLRDPETEEPIRADDPELADLGAMILILDGIAERRDAARCLVSAPGQTLSLVPDGRDVIVYDADRRYDIGVIPEDVAAALADALERGRGYRAISLWEVKALDGTRSELRVLIVPDNVALILAVDTMEAFVLDSDVRTV